MKYSESVKPISYLKTYASDVVRDVFENQKTMIITHNGEARVVLQDVKVYEKQQEGVALLKILALGGKEVSAGKYKPLEKSFKDTKKKIEKFKKENSEV